MPCAWYLLRFCLFIVFVNFVISKYWLMYKLMPAHDVIIDVSVRACWYPLLTTPQPVDSPADIFLLFPSFFCHYSLFLKTLSLCHTLWLNSLSFSVCVCCSFFRFLFVRAENASFALCSLISQCVCFIEFLFCMFWIWFWARVRVRLIPFKGFNRQASENKRKKNRPFVHWITFSG